MSAVSLSKFRQKLFPFFDIMKDTGVTIEVYHRRKVYELTVTPTDKKVTTPYRRKKVKQGIDKIPYDECEVCGGLMVGGICMAKENHVEALK